MIHLAMVELPETAARIIPFDSSVGEKGQSEDFRGSQLLSCLDSFPNRSDRQAEEDRGPGKLVRMCVLGPRLWPKGRTQVLWMEMNPFGKAGSKRRRANMAI